MFWGGDAFRAAYLQWYSHCLWRSPFECHIGQKQYAGRLKSFGCSAYLHISLKGGNRKLASHSRAYIMVGLNNGLYLIQDFETESLIVTKHVFMKHFQSCKWNKRHTFVFSLLFWNEKHARADKYGGNCCWRVEWKWSITSKVKRNHETWWEI